MKTLLRLMLVCFFVFQLNFICFAQVGIITTYAGPGGQPVDGALAITQAIEGADGIALDGAGGFYVSSLMQHRVYRVSAEGKIYLIAGGGVAGYAGDNGPATSAYLRYPCGVAVDSAGNLFIADRDNNRIRKVSTSGIITTVAGNGSMGYSGDGGPATLAQLYSPFGVAIDPAGNLFIADAFNNRIRKVAPNGIITTIAGTGTSGYSGDGGSAALAQLYTPRGIAIDSAGNLFISDSDNNIIRKISSSGIIATVAGNGTSGYSGDGGQATSAQLSGPMGVAVDSKGNLFIAVFGNGRIRKVSTDGIITTVAGTGTYGYNGDGIPATSAQLSLPTGVAVDSAGNLLIADYANSRVRMVDSSGIITTVAGNGTRGSIGDGGPATSAQLYNPEGVVADSAGSLFIADYGNHRIRKVSSSGIITTVAGTGSMGSGGDGGPATSALLYYPSGVAVDSIGNLFIADYGNHRIRKVSSSGIITTVAGAGTYGYSGDGGPAASAQLYYPAGVAIDSAGNIFIADRSNHRIRKVSASGIITTVAGIGSIGSGGDGGLATSAPLYYPIGIAVDSTGNLFIAENLGHRIRKVSASGIIATVAGTGNSGYSGDGGLATSARLYLPAGVALDSTGNLYIADNGNSRIRKVSASGIITTVAGTGTSGYSGDSGPATSAQLYGPFGLTVDSSGSLYIADSGNNRIRKVVTPKASVDLELSDGGVGQAGTVGYNPDTHPGYATVDVKSGAVPYGTAVFSVKQGGVTVSEAGVPASPPTTSARVFIDYRSGVNAIPARSDAGVVDVNTGIAVVNSGTATANVTYTLRNGSGTIITTGHGTIAAGKHFSCFINQLKDEAPDFNLPADFANGVLDITSAQPLSVLSLRGTFNQRKQFIITTTPTADLTQSVKSDPAYFAQFVDGGGYTTTLILMNTSSAVETGVFEIMDNNGSPLIVRGDWGTSKSSFRYYIPPNGIYRFQTDGSPEEWKAGWVKLTSDAGTMTPAGSGIFGYNPDDVLIAESGVANAMAATHARIYVDQSGSHTTGLAIANINDASAVITVRAYQTDGVTAAGTSKGPLTLAAHGHDSKFADQLITGLPSGFTGLLDVSSATPFAALTVRSLYNENDDYLMTTFPVADMNQAAPSPMVFPQIADGGGYETQIILLSTDGASSTTIHYYDDDGAPLAVGK
jgi:sugar lactone lactonase YvrE